MTLVKSNFNYFFLQQSFCLLFKKRPVKVIRQCSSQLYSALDRILKKIIINFLMPRMRLGLLLRYMQIHCANLRTASDLS